MVANVISIQVISNLRLWLLAKACHTGILNMFSSRNMLQSKIDFNYNVHIVLNRQGLESVGLNFSIF